MASATRRARRCPQRPDPGPQPDRDRDRDPNPDRHPNPNPQQIDMSVKAAKWGDGPRVPQAKHDQGFEPGDPNMQMYFGATQHQ